MKEGIYHRDWKVTFWTIFFSISSLTLFNLALFIPSQRIVILGFFILSIIIALIFFYISKINYNEKNISINTNKIETFSNELLEKFNYLRDIQDIKVDLEVLKKKKGNIELLDLLKVGIAIIFIYVIIELIRTSFLGFLFINI